MPEVAPGCGGARRCGVVPLDTVQSDGRRGPAEERDTADSRRVRMVAGGPIADCPATGMTLPARRISSGIGARAPSARTKAHYRKTSFSGSPAEKRNETMI